MDTLTISIIISIVGCFVGLAGWLSGRDKKISNDSEWRGSVNTKLDTIIGINKDVDELKKNYSEVDKKIAVVEASAKQAHHRIDDIYNKLNKE